MTFQMFYEGTFIIFGVTYLFFCIQIFCENPDGDIRGVIAMFWSTSRVSNGFSPMYKLFHVLEKFAPQGRTFVGVLEEIGDNCAIQTIWNSIDLL